MAWRELDFIHTQTLTEQSKSLREGVKRLFNDRETRLSHHVTVCMSHHMDMHNKNRYRVEMSIGFRHGENIRIKDMD
jgi:hypothetical protein